MSDTSTEVTCAGCGAPRPQSLLTGDSRTPCDSCGSSGLDVAIFVTDTTSVTETVELEVTPEEQDRDWRRRWLETQRELRDLLEPRTGPIDGEAIHAARHDLHTFFVNAYHIKDSLKLASATTGVGCAHLIWPHLER